MSDRRSDTRDPSRVPGADDENRGLVLRVGLVAAAAVGMAFILPPLGMVLGVVVAVAVVRLGARLPARARVVLIGSGMLASVIGLSITVVTAVFRSELGTYSACMDGANTHLARQNCQDALYASVSDRLGL